MKNTLAAKVRYFNKIFIVISSLTTIVFSKHSHNVDRDKFFDLLRSYFSHTSASLCLMRAEFNTDGVTGYIKAQYVNEDVVDFDVNIDLGDFQPDAGELSSGMELTWHLHTEWNNKNIHSGANNQCAFSLAGNHYDPAVACSPNSEWVNSDGICYGPDGEVANSTDYMCAPTSAQTMCERGDISGKLGPFIVSSNSDGDMKIQFKGRDDYFAPETKARSEAKNWSFVVHLGTARILCAQTKLHC